MTFRRKRKCAKDSYLDNLDRDEEVVEKRRRFQYDLTQFYRKKWNCQLKPPYVQGEQLDLFKLYQIVVTLGGWQKVSASAKWPEVLQRMGLGEDVAVAEHALKVHYMRYLSRFEQSELLGDSAADEAASYMASGSRTRGKSYFSAFSSTECPVATGKRSDSYTVAMREQMGMCAKLPYETAYSRLINGLISGLPNEVDFSLNVITLLSHPGPRLLKLGTFPKLIDLFVAHMGIFDEGVSSLHQLYQCSWRPLTGRRFADFWYSAGIKDQKICSLLPPRDTVEDRRIGYRDQLLFSGLTPDFNLKDPVAWRVFQLATILRNFSFEKVNQAPMAQSWPLMKFLLVCIHSRWSQLQTIALDILSNISCEMTLFPALSAQSNELLFRTLSQCLDSNDKLKIIRVLETVAGLCQCEANEALLCEFFEPSVLQKVFDFVSVKDIMMCVYTLECLYQASELGTGACEQISSHPNGIDVLVNLATIEAVSFGPSGLMGMKVVEFHGPQQPTTAILPHPSQLALSGPSRLIQSLAVSSVGHSAIRSQQQHHHQQQQQQLPHSALPSTSSDRSLPTASPAMRMPPPAQPGVPRPVTSTMGPPRVPVTPVGAPSPSVTAASRPAAHPTSPALLQPGVSPLVLRPPTPQSQPLKQSLARSGPQVSMHSDSRIDALTATWIKDNCRVESGASVQRAELYAAYVEELRTKHHSICASLHMFSNSLRSIFPASTIKPAAESSTVVVVEGVRFVRSSNPERTTNHVLPPNNKVAASCPLVQQILSSPGKTSSPQQQTNKIIMTNASKQQMDGSNATRPDSVDTNDLSGTATPESLFSEDANSNSPTGTKVNGQPDRHQQQQQTFQTIRLPDNSSLEICAEAVEAGAIIKNEDSHEAKILRVENVSKPDLLPVVGTRKLVNGRLSPSRVQHGGSVSPNPVKDLLRENDISSHNYAKRPNGVVAGANLNKPVPQVQRNKEATPDLVKNVNKCQANIEQLLTPENSNDGLGTTSSESMSATPEPNGHHHTNSNAVDTNSNVVDTNSIISNGPNSTATDLNTTANCRNTANKSATNSPKKKPLGAADDSIINAVIAASRSMCNGTTTASEQQQQQPLPSTVKRPRRRRGPASDDSPGAGRRTRRGSKKVDVVVVTNGPTPGCDSPGTSQQAASTPSPAPGPAMVPSGAGVVPVTPAGNPVQPSSGGQYMCEWDGCGRMFPRASSVLYHLANFHVNDETLYCKWPRCDNTVRPKWSLVTHLQDHHCSEAALRAAAIRRYELATQGQSQIPESKPPPQHPGYSKHAALEAIRRHAFNFLPREITDENEGPVTKSIRLTSCLILRNLARYSALGRRQIKRHERHLSWLAMSRLESSTALAQCLAELAVPEEEPTMSISNNNAGPNQLTDNENSLL